MNAGSYQVAGEHAEPSDFRDYLLTQLTRREPLHLEAIERHNELAVRRGLTPREFTFIIRAFYLDRGVETIEVTDADIVLTDLGSTNGTLLNTFPLPPDLPYSLRNGDRIHIGKLLIQVYFH